MLKRQQRIWEGSASISAHQLKQKLESLAITAPVEIFLVGFDGKG